MASITTIQSTDIIANSRTDINTNFQNLNNDKIETSYLDTDTSLTANSDTKIATQKAVKAYVDSGGNVNASETTKGIVEEATDAEVTAGTATGATGAKLFVTPAKLRSGGILKFGGTGADGALSITSGATNIDLASAQVVTKNYTSISITGTGSLTFTNPHANGTTIILKSQGNVTLTSSTAPMIDASGLGGAGGPARVVASPGVSNGATGTNGITNSIWQTYGGVGDSSANPGIGGSAGALIAYLAETYSRFNSEYTYKVWQKYPNIFVGSGGGSGGARVVSGASGSATSGSGGNGGGGLIIECGGFWNFTTANGISVAGKDGGTPSTTSNRGSGGGGGGGAGGFFLCLYNLLTSNSGTININGGIGSTGVHVESGGVFAGQGGGGGGSSITSGASGTSGVLNGVTGNGGNGGTGFSLVAQNTEYV